MKTSTTDGKSFQLIAETPEDFDLIGALDIQRSVFVTAVHRTPEANHWLSSGVTLLVDMKSPQARSAHADREARSAIGQVFRLGLSEAAQHRLVNTLSADPKLQEQLTTGFEELQSVLESLREVIVKQEVVIKELRRTHGEPLVVKNAILAEGGAT